nr:MAG TPA: hypothetical protein [Caudoviricetes sp.]
MIYIQSAFSQDEQRLELVGRQGEGGTRQLVFDCADILAEYPAALIVCAMQRAGDRKAYLKDCAADGANRVVTLESADVAVPGILKIELRALIGDDVRKSAVYIAKVAESLRGEQDRPGNPTADVLNRIDMTISRAEESIAEADAAAKSAREVADTVQEKLDNGDFVGAKGDKGDPGDVQDVQIAGASVLKDGVANVPIATADAPGVVSVLTPQNSGIWNDKGSLKISYATDTEISGRLGTRKAIVCANMDYAVKAAMCDGKGAAWTEAEQKAARERMGADGNHMLIEETVLTEETLLFERAQEPDGTPYNFSAIMLIVKFVPGQTNGAFFCYGKNNGIRIVGGASQTLSMPSLSGNANFRSVAVFNAKPGYGFFYNCETAVGSQGRVMEITRSSGGTYTMTETSKKIQSIAFYLYYNTSIQVVAGTEITIYGVRA